MKVAKLVSPKKIEIFEENIPSILSPNQALIRVKSVGICGTDLHIFLGHRSDVVYPRIMGHELSGIVVKVGDAVSNIKANDMVVLDPIVACGQCVICKEGHPNVCVTVKCFGVQMDGGFSEYIVVDASQLYKFSNKLTFQQAALVEPFSIAANIIQRAKINDSDNVILFGAGTIGLAVLQVVKARGAKILVSDVVDSKLQLAKSFGADVIVNSKSQNLDVEVYKFAPIGASVVIDAAGISPLFEQSIKYAGPLARIAVIGFDKTPAAISPINITKKELTIVGSRMNCYQFPKVLKWFEDKVVNPQLLISKEYSIDDIQKAFEYTINNNQNCIKTIINV